MKRQIDYSEACKNYAFLAVHVMAHSTLLIGYMCGAYALRDHGDAVKVLANTLLFVGVLLAMVISCWFGDWFFAIGGWFFLGIFTIVPGMAIWCVSMWMFDWLFDCTWFYDRIVWAQSNIDSNGGESPGTACFALLLLMLAGWGAMGLAKGVDSAFK